MIKRLVCFTGLYLLFGICFLFPTANAVYAQIEKSKPRKITTQTLLEEMIDFENLTLRPKPFFKQSMASSYSRKSHNGGEDWFHNLDRGAYVRTETINGRKEHVLADLEGPGAITRFWSANPDKDNTVRFYYDGEVRPRIEVPFAALFKGMIEPFGPDFSYISGTGGNLYYPIPFGSSLKLTVEEKEIPLSLYYEIGYRTYPEGTGVESFDPEAAGSWEALQLRIAQRLSLPRAQVPQGEVEEILRKVTVHPEATFALPVIRGEKTVFEWSARVLKTEESPDWWDPKRAHNAYRQLVLRIDFDGEQSILTPLGDFFGSAPGINPYENLFFSVKENGWMTSRLWMPFQDSMAFSVTNYGDIPHELEIHIRIGQHPFTDRTYHLRAQWGALMKDTWPPFDTNFLTTTGEGKVVGSVYNLANPVLIWWGEGDQKLFVDNEGFPSTFGTGTEDDYGYAYGYNGPFTRPYHAQTRVDGPASGGHISLNRWYVLDALPYGTAVRFDQEIWHWMPCTPTWSHVVYWYAKPGSPGPRKVDTGHLVPVDLGIRENMIEPFEGELLRFETDGGTAGKERLANCSRAEHLVWKGGRRGNRMNVHFTVPESGTYSVELNLCMSPEYGRFRMWINGREVEDEFDCYSKVLFWMHPKLGYFDLKEGDNVLEVEALESNPKATGENRFGLDYIFLIRH